MEIDELLERKQQNWKGQIRLVLCLIRERIKVCIVTRRDEGANELVYSIPYNLVGELVHNMPALRTEVIKALKQEHFHVVPIAETDNKIYINWSSKLSSAKQKSGSK